MTRAQTALALLASSLLQAQGYAATLAVTHLETQAAAEPLGLADPAPRLSWAMTGDGRGLRQACLSRPRRLEAGARPRRQGRRLGLPGGHILLIPPWSTRVRPSLRARATTGPFGCGPRDRSPATGPRRPGSRPPSSRAGEWKGQWIAGPERPEVRTAAEGEADDAAIQRRGRALPTSVLADQRLRRRPHQERSGRVPRAAPRAEAAQVLPHRRSPWLAPALYASGLAYDDLAINGKAVSASVLDPGFTDYSKTVLYTTHDVTALLGPGREHDRVRARLGPLRRRDEDLGLGLGEGPVACDARGCGSTCTSATPTGPSRWWRRTARGRSAWPVRPATTATTSARPTTPAARSPGWNRAGFDDSAWAPATVVPAPAGVLRAQTQEPIRIVSTRPPGKRSEPALGGVRLRRGPEPHRVGRDPGQRPGGHRRRGLLLGEARGRRQGQHGRQRSRLRPAPDRLLRGEGLGRRALVAPVQLQGLPVRPAQRSAGPAAGRRASWPRSSACSRCGAAWPRPRASSRATRP